MGNDFNPRYQGLTVIKSFPLLCTLEGFISFQKIAKFLPFALDYYKKPEIDLNLQTLQSKGNDFITVNPWYRGLKSIC